MNDGQNIFSDAQSADAAATEQDAQGAPAQVEAPAEGAALSLIHISEPTRPY